MIEPLTINDKELATIKEYLASIRIKDLHKFIVFKNGSNTYFHIEHLHSSKVIPFAYYNYYEQELVYSDGFRDKATNIKQLCKYLDIAYREYLKPKI